MSGKGTDQGEDKALKGRAKRKFITQKLVLELTNNKSVEKQVLVLLNRTNILEKEFNKGLVGYDQYKTTKNKICLGSCDLLDEVEEGDFV